MKSQTYLSRTELAKRLNKSTKTIGRWQQKWREGVHYFTTPGGQYIYVFEEILQILSTPKAKRKI